MSLREGPFQDLKVPLTWTAAIAAVVAAIIGLALLFGDRRGAIKTEAYGATKSVADTVAHPVGEVLSAPIRWTGSAFDSVAGYFFAVSENRSLHARVVELEQIHAQEIALANENARLRALLGLKTEPPIPMATARVITDARGPFANTRLADAGGEQGVAIGNPVMNERGLVGRIVGVARGVSRILLVTDVASRTPVLIDRTGARAILTGDGGPNPKLAYLRGTEPVKAGDRVLTSGDGGVFPRGLPVGVAERGLDGEWRLKLAADDAPIDFVRILKFTDFSQLASQPALAEAAPPPPLSPSEQADLAARLAPPPPLPVKPGAAASGAAAPTPKSAAPATAAKPGAVKPLAHKPAASKPTSAKAPAPKPAAPKPQDPPLVAPAAP